MAFLQQASTHVFVLILETSVLFPWALTLSKDSMIIKIVLVSYNSRFFLSHDLNVLGIYFV